MARDGWSKGPFDQNTRQHDALVPFEELTRADRHAVALYVSGEQFEETLPRLLEYPRGPQRPFQIEEIKRGLKVAYCPEGLPATTSEIDPSDVGVIESWDVDTKHDITVVRVRWADGTIEAYSPWEGVLARIEEL